MSLLSKAMLRPLPDRRYEVQLSRRAMLCAIAALACAAGLLYLGGLVFGAWLGQPVAAAGLEAAERLVEGPTDGAGRASGPAAVDAAREAHTETGGAAIADLERRPLWATQSAGSLAFAGSDRLRLSRGPRHRSFAYYDPWFRFSDPEPLTPFGAQIYRASRRHWMSPQIVAAVVWTESAFDPRAVSPRGARGLMQVMPATANRFGVGADRLFDPETNLDVGVRYLRVLSERYGGDLMMILAAYNAGEAAVDQYLDVPPYPETRQFVRRVAALLEPHRAVGDPFD